MTVVRDVLFARFVSNVTMSRNKAGKQLPVNML
jgi:hypothetical protein